MTKSQRPSRLIVTWAVLAPVLLIVALVFSPGPILGMFIAAAIGPAIHTAVKFFYPSQGIEDGDVAARLFSNR